MAAAGDEKTALEEYLDKVWRSIVGLPKTLRQKKYLGTILLLGATSLTLWFLDKHVGERAKGSGSAAAPATLSPTAAPLPVLEPERTVEQRRPAATPVAAPVPAPSAQRVAVPTPERHGLDQKDLEKETAVASIVEAKKAAPTIPPRRDTSLAAGRSPVLSATAGRVAIRYSHVCGEKPLDEATLRARAAEHLAFAKGTSSVLIVLAGGISQQVNEGSGTAALVAARFSVCLDAAIDTCDEPRAECGAPCRYSRTESYSGNVKFATHDLAERLGASIDRARQLESLAIQGDLCKTQ